MSIDPSVRQLVEELTSSVVMTYTDADKANLAAWVETVSYSGLNVPKMRTEIVYKMTLVDKDNVAKNIEKLVVFAMYRANNLKKIGQSISDEGAAFMNKMRSALSIKQSATADRKAITMARVTICFPELTAKLAHYSNYPGPVQDLPSSYPHIMRPACFSSLIPKAPSTTLNQEQLLKLRKAATYYSCLFTRAISKNPKPIINREMYLTQEKYIGVAIDQSTVSESRRHSWIANSEFGIIDGNGLKSIIVRFSECADALLNNQPVPTIE